MHRKIQKYIAKIKRALDAVFRPSSRITVGTHSLDAGVSASNRALGSSAAYGYSHSASVSPNSKAEENEQPFPIHGPGRAILPPREPRLPDCPPGQQRGTGLPRRHTVGSVSCESTALKNNWGLYSARPEWDDTHHLGYLGTQKHSNYGADHGSVLGLSCSTSSLFSPYSTSLQWSSDRQGSSSWLSHFNTSEGHVDHGRKSPVDSLFPIDSPSADATSSFLRLDLSLLPGDVSSLFSSFATAS